MTLRTVSRHAKPTATGASLSTMAANPVADPRDLRGGVTSALGTSAPTTTPGRREAVVVGIDPGLAGGLALIQPDGSVRLHPTPVLAAGPGGKREYDLAAMVALLTAQPIALAVIEAVGARPGQGVTSMFRFGYGFGVWIGLLSALTIPFEKALPQTWKKVVLVGTRQDKTAAIAYCTSRFPTASLLATPRSRVPHDGLADALCLAEYARRRLQG